MKQRAPPPSLILLWYRRLHRLRQKFRRQPLLRFGIQQQQCRLLLPHPNRIGTKGRYPRASGIVQIRMPFEQKLNHGKHHPPKRRFIDGRRAARQAAPGLVQPERHEPAAMRPLRVEPRPHRVIQRSATGRIANIRIGPLIQKQPHRIQPVVQHGKMHRGAAIRPPRVNMSAVAEQQRSQRQITAVDRVPKWRLRQVFLPFSQASHFGSVGIGMPGEQQLNGSFVLTGSA